MKTKLVFAVCCLAICMYGCSEAKDNPPPVKPVPTPVPEPPEDEGCPFRFPPPVPYPLADTQWQLIGSLDVATGELTTFRHPEECTDCYSLVFDTDSTATFRNSIQDLRIDLFHLDTCKILMTPDILIVDEKPEVTDAWHLHAIIRIAGSYAASPDALLLYYRFSERLSYLLFTKKEL